MRSILYQSLFLIFIFKIIYFSETLVKPDICEYFNTLKSVLESDKELFLKYKLRLKVVREINLQKANDEYYDQNVDECDILSDTTSMKSSQFSGSSSRTG